MVLTVCQEQGEENVQRNKTYKVKLLALANYSNSVGNNACHMILCRSYQAK